MTCKQHADMMAALIPPQSMGPKTRAIYDKFVQNGDEECIAEESQVVALFLEAAGSDVGVTRD